jgi:hypothetical protein
MARSRDLTIVDDWHATGMSATGSNTINHAIMHTRTALELYGRVLCGLPPNTPID